MNYKKVLKKIKNRIEEMTEDPNSPNFFDWTIFGILAVIIFTCFVYWDLFATTSHTTNFIEVISAGRILDFYRINYNYLVNGVNSMVCYDLPIYFILMIWNFPLWIAQHFFSVDIVNNYLCILWMKGILVLFLFLSNIVLKKICHEIGIKDLNTKWASLIFVSSPLVFSSLFILSQCDIIPIFFMLLGLLAYIKGDEKKFIIWFLIAIPMKIFPLFVFIPLLLLKEKRVLFILLKSAITISGLVVSKAIALTMPDYLLSTSSFNTIMLDKLLNSSVLRINLGNSSLFMAAYAGICIYCYIKNLKDKEDLYKYSIYIPFSVFSIFFLFVSFYPYWLIYLVPFFVLVLFKNSKYFKVNILVEMVFSFSSLFIISSFYSWCFGAREVEGMLLTKIFGSRAAADMKFYNVVDIYNKFGLNKYNSAFYGAFLATIICLLIINLPRLNDKKCKIEIERSTILLRMLLIVPLLILMVLSYYL